MAKVPAKRFAMGFFDVQNLYRHAKDAFGHNHPNFDPKGLHAAVCAAHGWMPNLVRFYTGVPEHARNPMWSGYWSNRVMALKRAGVHVTTRKLRYHDTTFTQPDGSTRIVTSIHEKGVDVRLALDIVKYARLRNFDVAVIYSQDQDLREVVEEVRQIAHEQGRQIDLCCAFPASATATSRRGIDGTQWFRMEQDLYDACLDPHDYRPPRT